MADFEALAAECRAAAFRLVPLARSREATSALRDSLAIVRANVYVSVAGTVGEAEEPSPGDSSAPSGAAGGADDEDDGLAYTLRVDKSQLPDFASAGGLAPRTVGVRDAPALEASLQAATSAFRFLRNACAGSSANQDACRAAGALQLAHAFVVGSCEWVDVELDAIAESVVLLAQVALQFSVNCATGNEASQSLVWRLYFPDHFQKILVECQEHRKVCAFTAALVLNCVNAAGDGDSSGEESPSEGDDAQAEAASTIAARRTDLVCARNLVIALLQRCMPKPVAASSASEPLARSDAADPAFEWVCLLFRALFRGGYARDLYNAVGAHMLSRLWSRVTPEQLILLRMLSLWVGHVSEMQRAPAGVAAERAWDDSEARALADSLPFVKSTWAYVISTDEEDRPEDVEPVRRLMWANLESEAKLVLLDVLGELTVGSRQRLAADYEDVCRELLSSVLAELRRVWQLRQTSPRGEGTAAAATAAAGDPTQAGMTEPEGYRSRLIRVAGNLCFRHTARQDLVREQGFLPLLLAHCNMDERNPLIREWALVALRNLCEGNEANQQCIDAMRPQSKGGAAEQGS